MMINPKVILLSSGFAIFLAWFLQKEALLIAVAFNLKSCIPYLLSQGYHVNGDNIVSETPF